MESDPLSRFYNEIKVTDTSNYQTQINSIFGKLEAHYYGNPDSVVHGVVVGSLGRGTAVSGTSDVDLLFILPHEVFNQFDGYKTNGQSALLQEIKKVLEERYPNTKIRGDGQAVVVDYASKPFSVDLVPAFAQSDGSFKYPDTHYSGSWKRTNPLPEQAACKALFNSTNNEGLHLCNALRIWRDNIGLRFKGLLIDTLVDNFCGDRDQQWNVDFDSRYNALASLFSMLSYEDKNKAYWYALGSNQFIYNDDKGAFVSKAKLAKERLNKAESKMEQEDALCEVFGKRFSALIGGTSTERDLACRFAGVANEEQFIEDLFPIDIRFNLAIDCRVTQDGFRPALLTDMLSRHLPLLRYKELEFYIKYVDVPEPYVVYWKVRNVGEYAYQENCIRGHIVKDGGRKIRKESTSFDGSHFVECYAVKEGKCVARARIDVPIVSH